MKDSEDDHLDNKTIPTKEKKNWVSPEINIWESELLQFGVDIAIDGAGKTYVG